jgi:dimethylhistidine N-methyltransferase
MRSPLARTERPPERREAPNFCFVDLAPPKHDFLADALDGLSRRQKTLSPKYFYDAAGSALFDLICTTEEYYVTRTELSLLRTIASRIAALAGPHASLIELGSGASRKARIVLDALSEPASYVAVEISQAPLRATSAALAADYPELFVGAVCADFTRPLSLPSRLLPGPGRRLGFLPGSTIGNFERTEACALLANLGCLVGADGYLVIGVDLKKDRARLEAAYNDARGYTAAFNRNILRRLRRELDAEIMPEMFEHHAFYAAKHGRIEMHLKARAAQQFVLGGRPIHIAEGETIHTENSYKYEVEEFAALAAAAGLKPLRAWTDAEGLFSIHLLAAPPEPLRAPDKGTGFC